MNIMIPHYFIWVEMTLEILCEELHKVFQVKLIRYDTQIYEKNIKMVRWWNGRHA